MQIILNYGTNTDKLLFSFTYTVRLIFLNISGCVFASRPISRIMRGRELALCSSFRNAASVTHSSNTTITHTNLILQHHTSISLFDKPDTTCLRLQTGINIMQ